MHDVSLMDKVNGCNWNAMPVGISSQACRLLYLYKQQENGQHAYMLHIILLCQCDNTRWPQVCLHVHDRLSQQHSACLTINPDLEHAVVALLIDEGCRA